MQPIKPLTPEQMIAKRKDLNDEAVRIINTILAASTRSDVSITLGQFQKEISSTYNAGEREFISNLFKEMEGVFAAAGWNIKYVVPVSIKDYEYPYLRVKMF